MTSGNPALDEIRKLLAKARGVTPAEAEALTAEATELMARYGIDRALLAATQPETDRPTARPDRDYPGPVADVHAHLLGEVGEAMRCRCILLDLDESGSRVHLFGYSSDLERAEMLYTSLLLQMGNALGQVLLPAAWASSPQTWQRSRLLG